MLRTRNTHTEIDTDTETDTNIVRHTQRHTHWETHTHWERHTHERDTHREIVNAQHTETHTHWERHTHTHTQRSKETHRDTHSQRATHTYWESIGNNCIVLGMWNSSCVMIPSCWEIREIFLCHGLSKHSKGPSFQRLEMLVLCYNNCHLSMTREKNQTTTP